MSCYGLFVLLDKTRQTCQKEVKFLEATLWLDLGGGLSIRQKEVRRQFS